MADEYPWEVELVGDQLSLGSGGRYLNINVALGGQGWHFGERKSDSWVSLYSLADWQEHIQVADVQQAYQQGLSGTYALSFDLMPGGGQIHDCDHADGFVVARLDGRAWCSWCHLAGVACCTAATSSRGDCGGCACRTALAPRCPWPGCATVLGRWAAHWYQGKYHWWQVPGQGSGGAFCHNASACVPLLHW